MTKQVLNRGAIANDGTGDTLRTASLKINQNFTEIYTKLGDGNVLSPNVDIDSTGIIFEGSSVNGNTTSLVVAEPTGTNTVTIPDHTGTLVLDTATQTLTNKTFTSPIVSSLSIKDADSSHQYNLTVQNLSANRNINLPLLGDSDTFVFNSHAATLSNKTLQAPTINNPIIYPQIRDSSGNELLVFGKNASAVNYVKIENASTGNPAIVEAAGEANSSLSLKGTGNGGVKVDSRLVLKTAGISASSGNISTTEPVTRYAGSVEATYSMLNGITSQNGELKYIVNDATSSVDLHINPTSSNIAGVDSVTISPNGSLTLLWFSPQWFVVGTEKATVSP